MKELGLDWIVVRVARVGVWRSPFDRRGVRELVGRDVKPGFNVFRFANRIRCCLKVVPMSRRDASNA